jgi:hypothetical protein
MQELLNLDQFRSAFRSGGLRSVTVRASGGSFLVTAEPRTGEQIVLAKTHGGTRRSFRDPGKAITILHRIGAHKVEVDTSDWSPEIAKAEAPRRPDSAERQRRAHAAAEHDAWFRAEVEQALIEADSPDAVWISNEEVQRESKLRIAEWRRRAAEQKGVA